MQTTTIGTPGRYFATARMGAVVLATMQNRDASMSIAALAAEEARH